MPDLADRYHSVRLLLETLEDPYPTPRGALASDSGPAPSYYVPCETCRRSGEVRARAGWHLCLSCDGRGWRRRERGDQPWDAYLNLPLDQAASLPRASRARRVVDQAVLDESFAWERALALHDRHGSYRAVRVQLDWLALAHARRHKLVRAHVVERQEREVSERDVVETDLGVLMITLRIPAVRVPPWLVERTSASADTVEQLLAAGVKPGEIARRLGMSKRAVQRKIRAGIRSRIPGTSASRSAGT